MPRPPGPRTPRPPAPELADLEALAERAVGLIDGEGQATVVWERRSGRPDSLTVTFTCVVGGRAGRTTIEDTAAEQLRRAARRAALRAGQARAWPSAGLPDPAPAEPHDGFDPAVLAEELPSGWTVQASRIAVASTRGVRAAEERSHVSARVGALVATAIGPAGIDLALLRREALGEPTAGASSEAADGAREREPVDAAAQSAVRAIAREPEFVLGPQAVAALLDRLRPAFGVDLALGSGPLVRRYGTRVAAEAVTLRDDPRHPGTLPRSFDAEGVPRIAVTLIEDGIACAAVHDTASAARAGTASTGHATQAATLAPLPENLVLAGGTAPTIGALCSAVDDGVYIAALTRRDGDLYADGAVEIRGGEPGRPIAPAVVELDPLAVLASVTALTAAQRLIALPGHAPGGAGAATVPALRATAGLTT